MQIPDEVRKCVVFVAYKTSDGTKLAGTAFLISIPLELANPNFGTSYVITAKHIIDAIRGKSVDQKVYLRINLKDGGTQLIETPINSWLSHPQELDVDIAAFNWFPKQEIFDYRFIPLEMAATKEIIEKEHIGVGDDVFLTGLFINHYGLGKNIPIIRVGNIASMPEEKVHTKSGDIDAYLIESRSIGGLSGSPVFVYMGALRMIGDAIQPKKQVGRSGLPIFYLLGLIHGHFDLPQFELDNIEQDSLINLQINMGIAIVIPVWKIMEVINQETFLNARNLVL